MLQLDDVFELSLWGLELVVEEAGSAGSEPPSLAESVRRRSWWPAGMTPREAGADAPARVSDPSPIGRLPLLASPVAQRRRARDAKSAKKR